MKKWQKGMNGNGQRDRWVNNEKRGKEPKGRHKASKSESEREKRERDRQRDREEGRIFFFFFVSKGNLPLLRSGQSRKEREKKAESQWKNQKRRRTRTRRKERKNSRGEWRRVEESGGGVGEVWQKGKGRRGVGRTGTKQQGNKNDSGWCVGWVECVSLRVCESVRDTFDDQSQLTQDKQNHQGASSLPIEATDDESAMENGWSGMR